MISLVSVSKTKAGLQSGFQSGKPFSEDFRLIAPGLVRADRELRYPAQIVRKKPRDAVRIVAVAHHYGVALHIEVVVGVGEGVR